MTPTSPGRNLIVESIHLEAEKVRKASAQRRKEQSDAKEQQSREFSSKRASVKLYEQQIGERDNMIKINERMTNTQNDAGDPPRTTTAPLMNFNPVHSVENRRYSQPPDVAVKQDPKVSLDKN